MVGPEEIINNHFTVEDTNNNHTINIRINRTMIINIQMANEFLPVHSATINRMEAEECSTEVLGEVDNEILTLVKDLEEIIIQVEEKDQGPMRQEARTLSGRG